MTQAEAPSAINPWERAKRQAGLVEVTPGRGFDLGDFDSFSRSIRGE